MNFKLLNVENNKTVKGEKKGYKTFILYLAPHRLNNKGVNLCSMATDGCKDACIFKTGYARIYKTVNEARLRRSNLFVNDRESFINQLLIELDYGIGKAKLDGFIPVVRLNGTSDIQWENIKVRNNKNIFELYNDVTFYDYTKIANRLYKKLPINYHLTFSYSGEKDYYNGMVDTIAERILKEGKNISVVFRKNLPQTFLGFPVIDGDEDDLRFTNEKGVVIGLHAKGDGKTDKTGFVIDC